MKILVDTMGADKGSYEIVKGAVEAKKLKKIDKMVLAGDEEEIKKILSQLAVDDKDIEILHCSELIENSDEPALAIRRKKDSSVVKCSKLLKEGQADGFISCGSTGAVLAAGTLIVGRIDKVERAALTVVIPGLKSPTIVLDAGANMDVSPELITQFAIMGCSYAKVLFSKQAPKISILSVGSEEGKGNNLVKEAYKLLEASDLNFVGNLEAREILDNDSDVLVCDGFAGNILLKSVEGVAGSLLNLIKEKLMSSYKAKIGALLVKDKLKSVKTVLDYREYGAAPLLGTKKAVFKGHGSSDSLAVKNGIIQMVDFINNDVIEEISSKMEEKYGRE